MSNIFQDGLDALIDTLQSNVFVEVNYTSKQLQTTYGIKAAKGNINWGTLNKIGDVALGENYRDWITQPSELLEEPMPGDTITDGTDVFEVYNPDTNSKCWRYCDPYKRLYRISTRRIDK